MPLSWTRGIEWIALADGTQTVWVNLNHVRQILFCDEPDEPCAMLWSADDLWEIADPAAPWPPCAAGSASVPSACANKAPVTQPKKRRPSMSMPTLRCGECRDPRIPPDCVHVSLEVQDQARRFVRTGGTLHPRYDEPWHAWSLAAQVALERDARAALCRTLPSATAALLRRGRCRQLVLLKMRYLHGPVPSPPGRRFGPDLFAPPPPTAVQVWDCL